MRQVPNGHNQGMNDLMTDADEQRMDLDRGEMVSQ